LGTSTEVSQPEEPEEPEESFEDYMRRVLQDALNVYPGESGPTLLGDFVLVIEGHTAEGTVLRVLDNDLTFWRRLGLVEFVHQQVSAEMAGNVAWATAQSYREGWNEDDGEGSNA
jgi:hypothetical protein